MFRNQILAHLCLTALLASSATAQTVISETPVPVTGEVIVAQPGEVIVESSDNQAGGTITYPAQTYPAQWNETIVYSTAPLQGTTVQTVSYGGSASDALTIVNQKRRRAGLYALQFDPQLTSVAQHKAITRANRRITGHDGLPKGGAAVEGVGFASGRSNLASQFQTCYLFSTGYRRAGAAIAYDGSGRAYYTLLLR